MAEPVNGAELIGDLMAAIGRLVIMSTDERLALRPVGDLQPCDRLLRIRATTDRHQPGARMRQVHAAGGVVGSRTRPLPANNITAATIFRTIEKYFPTLLLDEADTYLRDNEEMRGVLNSGHRRDLAYVLRLVEINGDMSRASSRPGAPWRSPGSAAST